MPTALLKRSRNVIYPFDGVLFFYNPCRNVVNEAWALNETLASIIASDC